MQRILRTTFAVLALPFCGIAAEPEGTPLFDETLANAEFPDGVWSVTDGVLTATKDEAIWTKKDYENFVLDLEFRTDDGTNSGVIIYATDTANWIPNSVEVQIADDFSSEWSKADRTWQCAAVFGRKAATRAAVRKPGEWNQMTITAKGPHLTIVLNGETVNEIDMRRWTDAKTNPDGTPIPPWLSRPLAELDTKGRIGFQGKHAGKPIYFRNIRIREAK